MNIFQFSDAVKTIRVYGKEFADAKVVADTHLDSYTVKVINADTKYGVIPNNFFFSL